jgi:hypothetical protein
MTIAADGFTLLHALYHSPAPACLVSIPAVDVLRRVWIQQFYGPIALRGGHVRTRLQRHR